MHKEKKQIASFHLQKDSRKGKERTFSKQEESSFYIFVAKATNVCAFMEKKKTLKSIMGANDIQHN